LFLVALETSRAATDWPAHASFLPFWRELLSYSLNQTEKVSTYAVSSKPVKLGKIQEVKNLMDGQAVSLKSGSWIPSQTGCFIVKTGTGTEAISVNTPPEESNPQTLNESFQWKELKSDEKGIAAAEIPAVTLPPNQGKQYWWILLVFVFLLVLGEVLLANRTAL
jgi:hypothetical protein